MSPLPNDTDALVFIGRGWSVASPFAPRGALTLVVATVPVVIAVAALLCSHRDRGARR